MVTPAGVGELGSWCFGRCRRGGWVGIGLGWKDLECLVLVLAKGRGGQGRG